MSTQRINLTGELTKAVAMFDRRLQRAAEFVDSVDRLVSVDTNDLAPSKVAVGFGQRPKAPDASVADMDAEARDRLPIHAALYAVPRMITASELLVAHVSAVAEADPCVHRFRRSAAGV